MEALIGTTIFTSGIRDLYTSAKRVLTHNHESLNNLLKEKDLLAKLTVAEAYIIEKSSRASVTQSVCLSQTHDQISVVNNIIEVINEIIVEHQYTRWYFFRTHPNISEKLGELENEITILDYRIDLMLKI